MERTRHGSVRLQVKVDGKTNNNNKELNSQLARLKFKRGQATGGQSTKSEGSRSGARTQQDLHQPRKGATQRYAR